MKGPIHVKLDATDIRRVLNGEITELLPAVKGCCWKEIADQPWTFELEEIENAKTDD